MNHNASLADHAGFGAVRVGDMQSTHPEMYVSLAGVATGTRDLTFGPGSRTQPPVTSAVTASAVATLSGMSDGRAFLSIGVGDNALHNIGKAPARLADLEGNLRSIRGLWRTGITIYRRREHSPTWYNDRHHIPVYVAAHGPKALEMAGRAADGVIVGSGFSPESIEEAPATG